MATGPRAGRSISCATAPAPSRASWRWCCPTSTTIRRRRRTSGRCRRSRHADALFGRLVEPEAVVEDAHRELDLLRLHDARDPDPRRRDHDEVDSLLGEELEHAERAAGVRAHADADDAHLGERVVERDALAVAAEVAALGGEELDGALHVALRHGEREVGVAGLRDVLD